MRLPKSISITSESGLDMMSLGNFFFFRFLGA